MQVLATTALTKVELIFHEKAIAIGDTISLMPPSTGADKHPAVSCVVTTVPEIHASMSTMFEHFESDHAPSTKVFPRLTAAPTVQTIVIDGVPIVNP
jgi:hypothetical protein